MGLLKAKKMFNNTISSLGFQLGSLEDVMRHLQEISALLERLFIEIVQAKKDTKVLFRFLNNLCIEVADGTIENATNDLAKDKVTSQQVYELMQRGDQYLLLAHISIYFEGVSAT